MKLEELNIIGLDYKLEIIDDETDIIIQEVFDIPNFRGKYAMTRIDHNVIPTSDIIHTNNSFSAESRWC